MKFKQTTTIVYTQEVELTEDEAQEIIGVPSIREKELSENWESDIIQLVTGDLKSGQNLTVNTEISWEADTDASHRKTQD